MVNAGLYVIQRLVVINNVTQSGTGILASTKQNPVSVLQMFFHVGEQHVHAVALDQQWHTGQQL